MRKSAVLGFWLLATLTSGCLDNKCDQIDREPVRYTDGHTNEARTFYQSSTPNEPLLRFPAARSFRLEHGLRETPVDVSVFVAFDATGERQSLAAGDQALLTITRDYIVVSNNTCADFFVRVTAWAPPEGASDVDTTSAEMQTGESATAETDAAAEDAAVD